MTTGEVFRFAGQALTGHRLRTSLSLLGVTIGVAAVVILTALGEGARVYVVDQFSSLGTNLLIVLPGKTETTGTLGMGGVPNDLTLEDAQAIARTVLTNPPNESKVSSTALASYPQCTIQSAHFSLRPVPYLSHSVVSSSSLKVFT